jgi:hypothetical protein
MPGLKIILRIPLIQWGRRNPIPGVCMTFTGMYLSGYGIGMVIIKLGRRLTRPGGCWW